MSDETSRYSLVIFDMDGTLTLSEPLSIEAWVLAVEQATGIELDRAQLTMDLRGRDVAFACRHLEQRAGRALPPNIVSIRDEHFRRVAANVPTPPGAAEMLDLLGGVQKCVASNARRSGMRFCLDASGLAPYFGERLYSGVDDVADPKPAPDVFLFAASALDVDPDECVVLEDSVLGIQAALAAGMHAVGYANECNLTEPAELTALGVPVITELCEFPAIVLGR